MATMQDVANLAQVSLSTVSYAINNTRPISAATRLRIERAMRELDFRPNQIARSLASRRSNILALTFPGTENAMGSTIMEFITGAAQTARKHGMHLVVWPYAADQADEMLQMGRQGLADGVILMEVRSDDARVRLLDEHKIPLTMIGRADNSGDARGVDIDFDATAEDAVAHLTAMGHTRIALLNQSADSRDHGYGPTLRVAEGFEVAMRRRGLVPADVLWAEPTPLAGRRAIDQLMGRHADVTALIAMNENAVIGAVSGLAAYDLLVPQHFSVLSIVTSPLMAQMVEPRLTTLHSPGADLGRLGVQNLLDQLDGRPLADEPTLLPCRWEAGHSTGPVPPAPGRPR